MSHERTLFVIVVDASHPFIMRNQQVIARTLLFLKIGAFKHY